VTVLEALKSAGAKLDRAFVGQPDVEARVRATIGVTYLRLGHYDEAEPMLRSAIRLLTEHYGTNSSDLAPVLAALGTLRQERGDFIEAEALYRRSLAIVRAQRTEPDQDEMDLLSNLADLLKERNELPEAEKLMRESLAYDRRTHVAQHLSVAIDLNNLGTVLIRRGQFAESEPLLREAVGIFQKTKHAGLVIAMGNHGEALTGMGRYVEAAGILERAVTLGVGQLGEKSQDLAKVRVKYGACLLKLKRHGPAEEQVLMALPILRASLGDANDGTQRALRLLVDVYDDWGKGEKAGPYRALLTTASS
jgi:tetratricopeptide (TPR) repeat protein